MSKGQKEPIKIFSDRKIHNDVIKKMLLINSTYHETYTFLIE